MWYAALDELEREQRSTHRARASGWYEDPEDHDLLRWWDGTEWSDTEFRAKPEDSELVAYVKSYQELSPRSPTNFLAISSLVQAAIALVAAALLAVGSLLASATSTLVGSTLLLIAELVVVLIGLWAAALGVLAIQNARRHQGRRIRHAIAAVLIAIAAVIVSVALLVQQFPAWLDGSGIAG